DAPRSRAVDLRGLDELSRHLREARVDRDDDEGDRAPHDQRRHHAELRERRPVLRRLAAMAHEGGDVTIGLDNLATEAWNADGADLDLRSTRELVELMNAEDARVPAAVAGAAA